MGKGTLLAVLAAVLSGMFVMVGVRNSSRDAQTTQVSHQEDVLARQLAQSARDVGFSQILASGNLAAGPVTTPEPSDGGWMEVSDECGGRSLSELGLDVGARQVGFVAEGRYGGDPAVDGEDSGSAVHCIAARYDLFRAFPAAIVANNSLSRGTIEPGASIDGGDYTSAFWGDASELEDLSLLALDPDVTSPATAQQELKDQVNALFTGDLPPEWVQFYGGATDVYGPLSDDFANLSQRISEHYTGMDSPPSIDVLRSEVLASPDLVEATGLGAKDRGIYRFGGDVVIGADENLTGSGILLIEGNLDVQGTLDWDGIVMVMPPGGAANLSSKVHLNDNTTIEGVLITEHRLLPPGGHIDVTAFRDLGFLSDPGVDLPQWDEPYGTRRKAHMYAPKDADGAAYKKVFTDFTPTAEQSSKTRGELLAIGSDEDDLRSLFGLSPSDDVGSIEDLWESLVLMKSVDEDYDSPGEAWPFWRHTHKYDVGEHDDALDWHVPDPPDPGPPPSDGHEEDEDFGGFGSPGGVPHSELRMPSHRDNGRHEDVLDSRGESVFRTASWSRPSRAHTSRRAVGRSDPGGHYRCRRGKFDKTPGEPFFDFYDEDTWSGGYNAEGDSTAAGAACNYRYDQHVGFIGTLDDLDGYEVYLQLEAPRPTGSITNHGQAKIVALEIPGEDSIVTDRPVVDGFGALRQGDDAERYKSRSFDAGAATGTTFDFRLRVDARRSLRKLWDGGGDGATLDPDGNPVSRWPAYIGQDRNDRADAFRVQLRMCGDDNDDGMFDEADCGGVDPVIYEAVIYWHSNTGERTDDIDEAIAAIETALADDGASIDDLGMTLTIEDGAEVAYDPMKFWKAANQVNLMEKLFRNPKVVSYHWSAGASEHPYEGSPGVFCHVPPADPVEKPMSAWTSGHESHGDYEGPCH